MTLLRVSRSLLPYASSSRPTCRFHIRQWHPRPPLRHASTIHPPGGGPAYKPRSKLRPYIWSLLFLAAGYGLGKTAHLGITLFPDVPRNSPQEQRLLQDLAHKIDTSAIVSSMLANGWEEVRLVPEEGNTIINQTLQGYMRMGERRAFWDPTSQEFVMVVWYGGALCGWPGIAHGGCTATFLLEGMGKGLNCLLGEEQAAKPLDPSKLGLTYLKPVKAENLYVLRADYSMMEGEPIAKLAPEKDMTKQLDAGEKRILPKWNKSLEVNCTIETMDGSPCVKAKGVWDIVR